jgi:hypothetical protein
MVIDNLNKLILSLVPALLIIPLVLEPFLGRWWFIVFHLH